MNTPNKVKCLDIVYDEESGDIVGNLLFYDLNANRLVVFSNWSRKNLHSGINKVPPTHEEMRSLLLSIKNKFKGKDFNLTIEDAPDKKELTEAEQSKYSELFRKEIASHLSEVSDGLQDDKNIIAMKLSKLMDQGKIDVSKMLKNELQLKKNFGV